ncbi:MAG: hypothetical protein H2043_18490 [Rhizobiales bacterium]|nr:hypothetical protein [Hyphomicrobiales bacterium]
MNGAPLVSDLVGSIIKTFRSFEGTGVQLAPQAVSTLIRNLRTVQELARDAEQEAGIQIELARMDAGRQATRDQRFADRVDGQIGGNVVRLPTRLRTIQHSPDGGDAA